MQQIKLKSSHLDKAAYDNVNQVLTVRFKSGHTYQYFGVPPLVFSSLAAAKSPGKLFNVAVRSTYKFKKLS